MTMPESKQSNEMFSGKTGLVLSGGGARGFAHLGVIQALIESGISIDRISGVSAGAIAAAFYASGFSPIEIMGFLNEKSYLKYFRLAVPNKGFVKNTALYKLMLEVLPANIEDLEIPTSITVTELNAGKCLHLESGPLARAVLASTSIPVIFQPVVWKKKSYVDGGVMNNLPVDALEGKCDHIIASHVNPFVEIENPGSIFKILERTFHLAIKENTENKVQKCNLFIEPPQLVKFKIFDFTKAPQLFDIGYEETMKLIRKLK
jgi:NTE family protein